MNVSLFESMYVSLIKNKKMETIIRIKPSELTPDFINKLKALLKNDQEVEISISSVSDFGLTKKESQKEYEDRLNRAIKNLEENKDTVSFSEDEFESLINDLPISK
jgi:hypothetical protein